MLDEANVTEFVKDILFDLLEAVVDSSNETFDSDNETNDASCESGNKSSSDDTTINSEKDDDESNNYSDSDDESSSGDSSTTSCESSDRSCKTVPKNSLGKRPFVKLYNLHVLPEGSSNVRDFPRYMCPECLALSVPRVYHATQLDNLKTHLRHIHRDKYESPFACPHCHKPFPKKQNLNYHVQHQVCKPNSEVTPQEVRAYRETMACHDR